MDHQKQQRKRERKLKPLIVVPHVEDRAIFRERQQHGLPQLPKESFVRLKPLIRAATSRGDFPQGGFVEAADHLGSVFAACVDALGAAVGGLLVKLGAIHYRHPLAGWGPHADSYNR